MIVRNVESGWEIVYQAAHALLAGRIAGQLRQHSKIRYWPETLAAIVDHDDHKEAFGKNVYLTELGAPKDFTQFRFTARERFEEVRRRIEHGYRKHRWVGLLAARHAEELYHDQSVSKKLAALLKDEQSKRASILADLQTSEVALESAYAILQWCDRTSLILCQDALPAMHRRLEVASLGDRKKSEIWKAEDGTIAVAPWPFTAESFDASVEVRTIPQLKFATDRELESQLDACAVENRVWKFQKG
ncbi:MAG TPA: DUF3891 family protein [Planctomycetaceae bacterium]|nr:DUF3891 family protein [Planctomycetaceae bacterium]